MVWYAEKYQRYVDIHEPGGGRLLGHGRRGQLDVAGTSLTTETRQDGHAEPKSKFCVSRHNESN